MKNRSTRVAFFTILSVVALFFASISIINSLKTKENNDVGVNIIATNFVGFDFSRAVAKDAANVSMLVKPGTEVHDFEPTPQDIIKIEDASLFVYIGGESEEWIDEILTNNDIDKNKTFRMMDYVPLLHEEDVEHEEEEEYDEHIWTNPKNAELIVSALAEKLASMYPERTTFFRENADLYNWQIEAIDKQIREIVSAASDKELVFADRFPFLYFVNEYGLNYVAAFPGCAEQTEASSSKIAELIDHVNAKENKVVLKIELTSDKYARAIANETGAKIFTLSAAHNISENDFNDGKTYVDIMRDNLKTLKEAL